MLTILHLLREPKIYELQMSLSVYEYVLRLQIPICNPLRLVQVLEYEDDLGAVELRSRLIETARSSQIAEDFTAGAIIKLLASASGLSG